MSILYYILITIIAIVVFFLVFPFLTTVLSMIKKEKIKAKSAIPNFKDNDFGCIITAYKNVEITRPLIDSLIKQRYNNFHVYLVADECDITGFDVSHEKLTVLNPNPSLRLKAKSIIHGIENFVRDHEYIAVFDADNLAHPEFLSEINLYVNNGHEVVQGQRTAKNLDTMYACADAVGEFYKNYIERYTTYLLGSSSVISGSGMAVEANLYKAYLNSPEIQAGKEKWKKMLQEDKILQNNLLAKDVKISYAKNAIVYDEKVTSGEQVETQRSRWLYSYFQNLPNSSGLLLKALGRLSWNQFYFGLVTIAPPLFILLFFAMVLTGISFFVNPYISLVLIGAGIIFAANILLTLKLSNAPKEVWKAIWSMPLFVGRQISALLKMGNPNKNFKHSEHTRSFSIDEVLQKSHDLPNER